MLTDEKIFDTLKHIDSETVRVPQGFKAFAHAIYKLGQEHRDDCNTCANRGKVYGMSAETYCQHCTNFVKGLKNLYEEKQQ